MMLFSNEEISQLHYLQDLTHVLNTIYTNLNEVLKSDLRFKEIIVTKKYFFDELKNSVLYVDNLFYSFEGFGFSNVIHNSVNALIDELNVCLKKYSKAINDKYVFLNNFISSLYDFFKKIDNETLFDSLRLINYSTSSEFKLYLNFLEGIQLSNNNNFIDGVDKKIIILEDKVNNLSEQNIVNKELFEKQLNKFVSEQKSFYDDKVDKIIKSFKSVTDDLQYEYEKEIKEKINGLKEDFENKRVELDALLGDVKLYQDKMTNKTVSEMSAHYYEKSKFERNSYFAVTIASAIIIIFSVISAYKGVNNYYNQYVITESCDKNEVFKAQEMILPPVKGKSYEECMKDLTIKREATQKYAFNYLIFRLSFSLLLFLAVIYASRIAMRAYNHWRQSENMYLKLNTLSPFIGSLDKSVRNNVHLSLVPDYFGKDAGMVENSKDAVKDLPTNISNIAIKAIEQAGTTIGSKLGSDKDAKNSDSESSTEKNKKKLEDESQ